MFAAVVGSVRRSLSLPGNGLARSVAVLTGGTIGGQALVVLAMPVITRLYSPAELGVLAVYMSLLTVLLSLASLRYEMAIPLPKDDRTAAELLALCFAILVGSCVLLLVPTMLFADGIASTFNALQLRPYLWLLPVGLLGAGAYQILSYWAIRQRAFTVIARTKLSQSMAQVGTQVALGLLGWGPIGLLVGDIAGRAGGSGTLGSQLLRRDRATLRAVTASGVRQVARRYRQFPLVSSGSSLLNTAGLQLPALMLAALYGPAVAGLFALAQQVIGIPIRLIGQSIAQVYLGEASRLVRDDPASLRPLFARATRRLLYLGVPPVVGAALLGPWLADRLFGAEWAASGTFVLLLVPMFAAQLVVNPLSQTAVIMERQGWQLVADVIRTVAVIGSLWLPYRAGWSSGRAIAAYSACMAVTYVGYYVLYVLVLRAGPGGRSERV